MTPTAHYLEYLDHAGPVLAEPVRVRDGQALISEQLGSGVDWDEAVLGRLADQGEVRSPRRQPGRRDPGLDRGAGSA